MCQIKYVGVGNNPEISGAPNLARVFASRNRQNIGPLSALTEITRSILSVSQR